MQRIVYPGAVNQPCQAEYGISITRDDSGARADIVVIDSREAGPHHTPLIHTPLGRDLLLNKVLSTDLQGIRLDLMRFFVIVDAGSRFGMTGYEYPIRLDLEDYQRKGHPIQVRDVAPTSLKGWLKHLLGFYVKTVSVLNRDVVGGRASVRAGVEKVRALTAAESSALMTAVGYEAAGPTQDGPPVSLGAEKSELKQRPSRKAPKHLH
jgi:hypothetical protein